MKIFKRRMTINSDDDDDDKDDKDDDDDDDDDDELTVVSILYRPFTQQGVKEL